MPVAGELWHSRGAAGLDGRGVRCSGPGASLGGASVPCPPFNQGGDGSLGSWGLTGIRAEGALEGD